jgi:RecB family exonuclease
MVADISKLTLSPTKVDTFLKCQRKFYYNYLNQPFPQIEHSFFIVGNVAHKALEVFHGKDFYAKKWHENMANAFKVAVASQNALEKVSRGMLTLENLFEVKTMLKGYISFLRNGNVVNVYQLEKLVNINIKNVPVWLKADRVDLLPEGGYAVVDYKTSKTPASKREEQESVQLPSYGMWVRQKINKLANIQGEYYYLRYMNSKKGIHRHQVTDAWMEKAADQYVMVYSHTQNGCAYSKTTNKQTCRWCDYRLPCHSNFGFN